jgi:8-oxo-dGTP diphosphatase
METMKIESSITLDFMQELGKIYIVKEDNNLIEKTFGQKELNKTYTDRVGAYGVGFDKDGKIPVAMTHLYNGNVGYFLLGGGIDNDESHSNCIERECLEEAGLKVRPLDFVCKGDHYLFIEHTETYFHGIGYFYYMEIDEVVAEPTEPDHYLAWLTIDEAKEKLFLPHQIWAVEEIYKTYVKNA